MVLKKNLVKEYGNNYVRFENQLMPGPGNSIDLCLIEPVSISTQVDFQPAPIATVGESISKFLSNPMLEVAGAVDGKVQKTVLTGMYSALILGGNKNVLKFDLKFRTYDNQGVLYGLSTTKQVIDYFNKNALISELDFTGRFEDTANTISDAASTLGEMLDTIRGTPDLDEQSLASQTATQIQSTGYDGNKHDLTTIYKDAVDAFLKNLQAINPEVGCKITELDLAGEDEDFRYHVSGISGNRYASADELVVKRDGEKYGLKKFNHAAGEPIALDESAFKEKIIPKIKFKQKKGNVESAEREGKSLKDGWTDNSADKREHADRVKELLRVAREAVKRTNEEYYEGLGDVTRKAVWHNVQDKIKKNLGGNASGAPKGKVERLLTTLDKEIPFSEADYQASLHEVAVLPLEPWLTHLYPRGVYDYAGEGNAFVCVVDRFEYTFDKFNRWCDWNVSVSTHTVPAYTK